MKRSKKVIAGILTATILTTSAGVLAATSSREAWNNAASTKTAVTQLEDQTKVYPNVYAEQTEWSSWIKNWDAVSSDYEKVALTPGKNATQLNFAWYSRTQEIPKVRLVNRTGITVNKTFSGTQDKENAITLEGVTYYPNKVTITGLKENTTYYYQYSCNGIWSDIYTYETKSTDSFELLYVGDPQIGASTGQEATMDNTFTNPKEYFARNDAYNWEKTLQSAFSAHPNVSFMLSAGDQINEYVKDATDEKAAIQQQKEYAGFLNPSILRSLPIATTIGNHDARTINYKNHFNNPNVYIEEVGASIAGNDYYFSYGNALFIVINTNNYNCQTHKDFIQKAIQDNPEATWRVLMFHQDIYGSGYDHSDTDGMILRTQLTPIIDEADIDVVLQGHDHTFSRTFQLSGDGKQHTAFKTGEEENFKSENASCYEVVSSNKTANKVINPEGTVYMEANSASGSKFYQLIATAQDYVATRSQSWRPTYAKISIDKTSFTITTYDAATNEILVGDNGISSTYTIVKEEDITLSDSTTGIQVKAPITSIDTKAKLTAKQLRSGAVYKRAKKAVDSIAKFATIYTYTIKADEKNVMPSENITISLPIPNKYNTSKVQVYKVGADGKKSIVNGSVSNNMFVFETRRAGTYALIEKK